MNKKIINVIAAIEIIIGILGSLVFVCGVLLTVCGFIFYKGGLGAAIGLMLLIGAFPFPFMIGAGIGILKQKDWALKFQRVVAWISACILFFWTGLHVCHIFLGNEVLNYLKAFALDIFLFLIIVVPLWKVSRRSNSK